MSVEASPHPLSQELSVQDRAAQLREQGMTAELNTVLNQRVGFEKQALEAMDREEPLWEANRAADAAEELEAYQNSGDTSQLSERAQEALEAGETPNVLLQKAESAFELFKERKAGQEAELDFDEKLDVARSDYINLLVKQPKVPGKRKAHREQLATAEQAYNGAFVEKVTRVMELDELHPKAPYAPPVMHELTKEAPALKELAGNRLHVLVDQLAREQLTKGKMIESLSNRNAKRVLNALNNSRPLKAVVFGAVFAGSAVTMHEGLLPEGADHYVEGVQYAMELLPAYLTLRESTLAAGEGLDRFKHHRQMKHDMAELTDNTLLSDLALRTIYSNVEYQDGEIPARSAGDADKNNLAFADLDDQFSKLEREGYRGGKPYTAEQVLPYVTDLYIHRKEQIDGIITSSNPQAAFVELCREVIAADSHELTKENQANAAKKTVSRAFALAGAVLATKWVNQVSYMNEIKGAAMAVPHVEAR